jgi:hypothetical protein
MPEATERFEDAGDLLGAFEAFAADAGGEDFGCGSVASAKRQNSLVTIPATVPPKP